MKKRICILYTGGTIGMVPSEKGYVPSSGAFLDLLRAIPDLYWADMPEWDVVEFDPLLDSSDITVREWNQIGAAIAARYDDYDGFVVLNGTDTMAYSASAISFMLEKTSHPPDGRRDRQQPHEGRYAARRLYRAMGAGAPGRNPCLTERIQSRWQ